MKKYMKNQGSEDIIQDGSILFEYHSWEDTDEVANMDEQIKALLGREAVY